MAGPYSIFLMPDNPVGQKLAPEVIAEIQAVAPSTVTAGSISTAKLAVGAVTSDRIGDGEVKTVNLDTGAVTVDKLGPEAVETAKIADHAVTPVKTGTGVVTAVDSANAPVATLIKYVTATEMAAITSPDPNTEYHISA